MRRYIRYPLIAATILILSILLLPGSSAKRNGAQPSVIDKSSPAHEPLHVGRFQFANLTAMDTNADLTVTKSGPDTAAAGSNVTYTIEVQNLGPDDADTATLTDPLPQGMTFVSLASPLPAGWQCSTPAVGANGTITCTNPNFPANGDAVFTLVATLPAGAQSGSFFTNEATMSSNTFDPNDENDSSAATTFVGTTAGIDVGVIKTANSDTATAGSNVTYTIKVTASGNPANVVLNDPLPSGMTFVSLSSPAGWSCSTPAVGANGNVNCTNPSLTTNGDTFTLVANVPSATPSGTLFLNTATVSTSSPDENSEDDSSEADVTVAACSSNPIVTNNADSGPGSLRQAILDACDGSTITFDMTQVTSSITLTSGELLINKNLTIQGPSANSLTISGNQASRVFEISGNINVTLDYLTIANGKVSGGSNLDQSGGGIFNNGGTLTITNSTISGNQVSSVNNSVNAGGGIFNYHGTLTITNSTISGNQVSGGSYNYGGGIDNHTGDTLTITNSTIAGNQVSGGNGSVTAGGGIYNIGTAKARNTIVAGNTVSGGTTNVGPDVYGTFTTQGHNLIGKGDDSNFTNGQNGDQVGSINSPLDPKLDPNGLQPNGGPTKTISLQPGSPAVNAGDDCVAQSTHCNDNSITQLTTDQRGTGFPRLVGSHVDIGAFEVQAGTPYQLAFSVQPTDTTPGAAITPPVKVQILDVVNNLVTTSSAPVTIAIGTNPSGGTLSGTTTVNAVNGVATFSDLSINMIGSGYTLTASSNGLIGATSNPFNILSPAHLSGTKTVSGTFNTGNNVTYTVTIFNSGPAAQLDNPGNEFTDALPSGLTLVSASATSGTAVATVGTNTVTWNGSIPSSSSVTITITATINSNQAGQTITNQGTISYDADGNGTNESTKLTDDPNVAGSADATSFHVNAPPTISAVGVTRTAGSPSANSTIANVSDAEDAKNTLAVTVNNSSSATTNGVTVSNLKVSSAGVVTADVVAACGATTANFTLKVTDSGGLSATDTLAVTVNSNPAPTLTYNNPSAIDFGASTTINPATGPSDNGSVQSIVVQNKGTYTGGISVDNTTGVVSITNAAPAGTHTVTIRATDNCGATTDATFNLTVKPQPTLSINDVSLAEGNSGTTNFNFTVTLSAASSLTVTVNYATADATATTANNDYQAASGTLTFTPGQTTQTITVKVNGDTTTEADETFTVNLTSPVNAGLSKASGTGTILNDDGPAIQFSASSYTVGEGGGDAVVTVNRLGDLSQPASINYATSDQSGLNPCSQVTGMASQRCDYAITIGTLKFAAGESSKQILIPIVDDAYVEGPEVFTLTLSNPQGGVLQGSTSTTITITDNDVAGEANPLDQDTFFVRQLYLDFLDREPDPPGLQGWLNILHGVNSPQCQLPTDCDRIAVALGFVNSPEFTDRGYFIYRLYKTLPDPTNTTFGRIPHYFEFVTDMAKVSGFLTTQDLDAAKDAFIAEFMSRAEFTNKYGATVNDPAGYVDALLQTVGLPNHPSRNTWVAGLTNGTLTRGQVLRQLVESAEVMAKFKNEAFVLMNYFGFLRRDADAAFTTWIQIFNDTNDQRVIINGFLNSQEYRQRFAP